MPSRPLVDMSIQNPFGAIVAAVEVKNRPALDEALAAGMRRNWVAHGLIPRVPYFLLVSQWRGFLWASDLGVSDARPDRSFDMSAVIRRYAPTASTSEWLRERELELVIMTWLSDLIAGASPTESGEAGAALAESGFVEAVRGGSLQMEAAA